MTWLGADELDLLVLGSGVAGLSAAVRAADELALRVGRAHQVRAVAGRHPLGAGRCRRGPRRRPRLHRPPPRRHAQRRCRPVRRRRRAGPRRRGTEPCQRAHRHGRDVRPRPGGSPAAGPGGRALAAPRRPRRRGRHRRGDRAGAGRGGARDRGRLLGAVVRARPARRWRPLRRASRRWTRTGR